MAVVYDRRGTPNSWNLQRMVLGTGHHELASLDRGSPESLLAEAGKERFYDRSIGHTVHAAGPAGERIRGQRAFAFCFIQGCRQFEPPGGRITKYGKSRLASRTRADQRRWAQ